MVRENVWTCQNGPIPSVDKELRQYHDRLPCERAYSHSIVQYSPLSLYDSINITEVFQQRHPFVQLNFNRYVTFLWTVVEGNESQF